MPEEHTGEEIAPKRKAIVDAARALFTQKGYVETTIPQIAQAAGIAVGTVYLYFHNKYELLAAASLDLEATLSQAYSDPTLLDLPLEQVPQALVESMFRLGRQKKEQMALLHITMPSAGEVPQRRKLDTQIAQAIETFLRNAIAQGRLGPLQHRDVCAGVVSVGSCRAASMLRS